MKSTVGGHRPITIPIVRFQLFDLQGRGWSYICVHASVSETIPRSWKVLLNLPLTSSCPKGPSTQP